MIFFFFKFSTSSSCEILTFSYLNLYRVFSKSYVNVVNLYRQILFYSYVCICLLFKLLRIFDAMTIVLLHFYFFSYQKMVIKYSIFSDPFNIFISQNYY